MTLPSPNLDDRRFQDLVDDAKRMVQQRCPEWTDHNVHDPGVTLIETFAFMTDQLLYRLNQVPDRVYLAFLDLIGVQLLPPTAARTQVTFRLSAAQDSAITIPLGTSVATPRTEHEEPVVFATTGRLEIPPCSLELLATSTAASEVRLREQERLAGTPLIAFQAQPAYDDALLFGLDTAVPSCVLVLDLDCTVEGVGVDPTDPPLVWEAWSEQGWVRCEVESDETGGLNKAGAVTLHVPAGHIASVLGRRRAGWVRCRVIPPEQGQPYYSSSPVVHSSAAATMGGTVEAVHGETVTNETLGVSEGVPGQRFALARTPVLRDIPLEVEVAEEDGWHPWTAVSSFAGSSERDRHVLLDATTGEVTFGPAVRLADGTVQSFGAVPPKDAVIRVRAYRTGGGAHGNLSAGTLNTLTTSIPFISDVRNRRAAHGGVDGESVEDAKVRGPLVLRTRDRAVTTEDYEMLAHDAAPNLARVRCLAATTAEDAGGVRVLVVPDAVTDEESGTLMFADLVPPESMLAAITEHLEPRRVIGTRVVVEPPFYQGVTVVARVQARPRTDPDRLKTAALRALNEYFSPLTGGPQGQGWPFGRPVQAGEVYAALQRLPGTELVEDVKLFAADPITGERGDPVQRIALDAQALVFSYEHQVRVVAGG